MGREFPDERNFLEVLWLMRKLIGLGILDSILTISAYLTQKKNSQQQP